MISDGEVLAWILLSGWLGGVAGHWMGTQRAIRLCRRIAKSQILDDVFREDATRDTVADDVVVAARRRFQSITGDRG